MRKNKGKFIVAILLATTISSNIAFASGLGRASIVRFNKVETKIEEIVEDEEAVEQIIKRVEESAEASKPIAKDLSKTTIGKKVKVRKSLYAPIVPNKGIRISSSFGSRIHPISKTRKTHWGIDIAAPSGTLIHAIADGEIIMAKPNGSAGNEVKIKHTNGVETRYLHMSKRAITKGDKVKAGQVIGTVGSTGRSTGAHLHFEVKIDGKTIDPSQLFSK